MKIYGLRTFGYLRTEDSCEFRGTKQKIIAIISTHRCPTDILFTLITAAMARSFPMKRKPVASVSWMALEESIHL